MTTETQELRDRVEAKRKRMEAEIHELKADASKSSRDRIEDLEEQLGKIQHAISNGYDDLKSDTIKQINEWLADN